MRKYRKILSCIFVFIICLCIFENLSIVEAYDWSSRVDAVNNAASGYEGDAKNSVEKVSEEIIKYIQIAATGIAIIMLMVLGMKYMIAAPGDRADIKKHAIVYVIGAVVLFGSSAILGVIDSFASSMTSDSSVESIVVSVVQIVQVIGVGIASIMLLVLGIKYLMASPGDKADIKKHAIVYLVGATVLFGASGILGIIKTFASEL